MFERISEELKNLSDFLSLRGWILFIIDLMQNVSLESQETDSEIKKIAGRSIIKMGFLPDSTLFSVGPEILKSRLGTW